jgi:citrate lyase subunit beta/citryl-CoA lyase
VGAFTVGGKMVDAPFVRRAEQILALARRLGLIAEDERGIE